MLSLANITLCSSNIFNNSNVSALDYSSNVGIGFTFNPTLSVSISPSDLVIPNLVPGSMLDSNSINVSVATNAAYGYTLSANVNDENLVHSNNIDTFSSIDLSANLETLTVDNTWGYTSKLSNETVWSNYNGLSNSSNAILLDNSNAADSTGGIDFKIAAKAGNTQPSGEYTGTINFIAITKPTPMNLAESYFAHGKTRHNGYYTMQDMTTEICNDTEVIGEGSQTELIDIRDNKVYWATKLADNHCWMTQNLDLDLDSNRTYTHWDTDLGWTVMDEEAEWKPERSTINFSGTVVDGWVDDATSLYSANPGDIYYYTSNSGADDTRYNSLQECILAEHNNCTHYHAGNYYNGSAAVASNNTVNLIAGSAADSICPNNWRLPSALLQNDIGLLWSQYDIVNLGAKQYKINGFNIIRSAPLFFVRAGGIKNGRLQSEGGFGFYWTAFIINWQYSTKTLFWQQEAIAGYNEDRAWGNSIRCLAR